MKIFILLVLFTALLAKVEYKDYKLITVTPTESEISSLNTIFAQDHLDVWTYDGVLVPNQPNEILVAPNQLSKFENIFSAKTLKVLNPNMQQTIENEEKMNQLKNTTFFTKYHRYQEIHNFLKGLETQYKDLAEVFILGKTYENRTVYGLKVNKEKEGEAKKKLVWISALQHAREWYFLKF